MQLAQALIYRQVKRQSLQKYNRDIFFCLFHSFRLRFKLYKLPHTMFGILQIFCLAHKPIGLPTAHLCPTEMSAENFYVSV